MIQAGYPDLLSFMRGEGESNWVFEALKQFIPPKINLFSAVSPRFMIIHCPLAVYFTVGR